MATENPNPKNVIMAIGSCYIPKDNPDKPLGDDAHFFCEAAQVIGLADGVGGWSKRGIDAGKYARALMKNAENSARAASTASALNPMKILRTAYSKTKALGTSTACILRLDGGGLLLSANLGDSGFMVIRNGDTVYRSEGQYSRFNCPYQLGTSSSDAPRDAEEVAVVVESGDVVVAATDGLFDNLFSEEIEETVRVCLGEGRVPASLAAELAARARRKSLERAAISPFDVAARGAGIDKFFGGKYDDVTVVVGYVVEGYVVELRLEGFEYLEKLLD